MRRRTHNYVSDGETQENFNVEDKYAATGESEWSRDLTVPYDENTVLSERHMVLGDEVFARGNGPKGWRRNDAAIYEDVCETLWQAPQVDPSEIEVSVEDGVVRLQGVVHRRDFKRWAERLVEHLPGVVDVMNEIRVEKETPGLFPNRTGMA